MRGNLSTRAEAPTKSGAPARLFGHGSSKPPLRLPAAKPIHPCASKAQLSRRLQAHPHPSRPTRSSSPHGSNSHSPLASREPLRPSSRRQSGTSNKPAPARYGSPHSHRTTYSRTARHSAQSATSAATAPPRPASPPPRPSS